MNFAVEPDFEQDLGPLTEREMKDIKKVKDTGIYQKIEYERYSQKVILKLCEDFFGHQLADALKHLHPRYRVWFIDNCNGTDSGVIIDTLSTKALLNFCRSNHPLSRRMLSKLPIECLPEFMNHEEDCVRDTVSELIDPSYLPQMMNDKNDHVIFNVVKRIDPLYLPDMMVGRYDWCAEAIIERIDPGYLFYHMNNNKEVIRKKVAQRIDPHFLPEMMKDRERSVRAEVARRIDPRLLGPMLSDPTSEVRDIAYSRIPPEYVPKRCKNKFNERVMKSVMET